jgi:predicted RNase H-like HicB family nuclease
MNERYDHYSMVIKWSEEDDAYIVTVPELPGCITHGDTYEEAVHQGEDAIETWIDGCLAWGYPIPEPRVLPKRNRNLVSKAS